MNTTTVLPAASSKAGRPAWLGDDVFPFASRRVEVDGHAIHYVDEGCGPTVLFVHPAPASSFMYREFIAALRDEYRCIALDYPGFGLSELAPGASADLVTLSAAVAGFVETLDLRDVTMLVHDTGGPVGLGAAVRDPLRYRRFVVSDTMGFAINRYLPVRMMLGLVTSRPVRALNRRYNVMPRVISTLAPVGGRTRRLPQPVPHARRARPHPRPDARPRRRADVPA